MTVTVLHGDCTEIMPTLAAESIHAAVCDPPYHLQSIVKRFGGANAAPAQFGADGAFARQSRGFMQKTWDGGDVAFRAETWAHVYRLLKPGAYIAAFSSCRTFHRMAVAIEDAGFITHPFVAWIFATGFPKATRVKDPAWEGWRYGAQALKPAIEPIYIGQKPFERGLNGTENVLKHGTGAINVEGCRIETSEADQAYIAERIGGFNNTRSIGGNGILQGGEVMDRAAYDPSKGRWPANVILSYPDDSYLLRRDITAEQKSALYRWMNENA